MDSTIKRDGVPNKMLKHEDGKGRQPVPKSKESKGDKGAKRPASLDQEWMMISTMEEDLPLAPGQKNNYEQPGYSFNPRLDDQGPTRRQPDSGAAGSMNDVSVPNFKA